MGAAGCPWSRYVPPMRPEILFPLYAPIVESITVVRRGIVRRAKLYYLRGRTGKRARIAERRENAPKAS